ncbi:hypothetical protein F4560_002589 [Saccharothrix ecbatanensis]|uniref:Putative adhesin Stv domain-containing protein n=1 Tax=Saccharothrix ecbatanensis TaxID=1105145 RepID=A0A7W9HIW6_9PSEU|nr:hypothetical protein [Saccharothrix ecbatanensis]MBB5802821.1 hypothetical protein [Saccharothrix ecbatanensis]
MHKSGRHRNKAEDEAARQDAPAPHRHPHQEVLDLQRQIGNRAVAEMFTPVQRASRQSSMSSLSSLSSMEAPEGMDLDMPAQQQDEYGAVVSGHGRFSEGHLATERRTKRGTFTVPQNMTVRMYAPNGAYLDNAVANRIETGQVPRADELELKQTDSAKVEPMPAGYPWTFTAGQEVVDYTVRPPDGLSIQGSPITVDAPTPLRVLVERAAADGHTQVHYACCSSGYSDNPQFAAMFTHRGYYVRFKEA